MGSELVDPVVLSLKVHFEHAAYHLGLEWSLNVPTVKAVFTLKWQLPA